MYDAYLALKNISDEEYLAFNDEPRYISLFVSTPTPSYSSSCDSNYSNSRHYSDSDVTTHYSTPPRDSYYDDSHCYSGSSESSHHSSSSGDNYSCGCTDGGSDTDD